MTKKKCYLCDQEITKYDGVIEDPITEEPCHSECWRKWYDETYRRPRDKKVKKEEV